jgi:hypothetical protein
MSDEQVKKIIETCKAQAQEYAKNYVGADPQYRKAIKTAHFVYLINEAIKDLTTQASLTCKFWATEN